MQTVALGLAERARGLVGRSESGLAAPLPAADYDMDLTNDHIRWGLRYM
jgi:hypothetical protein